MKNREYIRNEFKQRFQKLANHEEVDVSILCPWPHNLFLDDSLMARWQSESLMRVMRLQETDDDGTLQIGYAVGRSGVNYKYEDLLVVTHNSNKQVELIFKIYKLWFVENKTLQEMEDVLENLCKSLNST